MNHELVEKKWNKVKSMLQIGDEVEGKVIHKAPFRNFIDIGVGFPALLQIVDMAHLTTEIYKEDSYQPLGTVVRAKIIDSRDHTKQILVTQKFVVEEYPK